MTLPTTTRRDEGDDRHRPLRVLAVHAHPDDEALWTGLTLAHLARRGAHVSVLTCTLGEEGEVIGEKYRALQSTETGLLGGYRIAELREALAALGLHHGPQLLGGAGAWRDSGMAGSAASRHPRAFSGSGDGAFQEQVRQLVEVLGRERPDVLITYGPDGGYGHPDHIRAHQISHAAVQTEGAWRPREILWAVTERELIDAAAPSRAPDGWTLPAPGEIAAVPGASVDLRVQGSSEDLERKTAALRAHATQLWVADGSTSDVNPEARTSPAGGPTLFCLSNLLAQPLLTTESYQVGWRADPASAEEESCVARWLAGRWEPSS